MRTNLLAETLRALEEFEKTPDDVLWVGVQGVGHTSWGGFAKDAASIFYENGGRWEVSSDLVVVGDGWWLERIFDIGRGGWGYRQSPQKPQACIIAPDDYLRFWLS